MDLLEEERYLEQNQFVYDEYHNEQFFPMV